MKHTLTYKKTRSGDWVHGESCSILCNEGLNEYFHIPKSAKEIDVVISTTPLRGSYFVEKQHLAYNHSLLGALALTPCEDEKNSERQVYVTGTDIATDYLLSRLIKYDTFYVKVYA